MDTRVSASTAAPAELFVLSVLEALVDNQGIGWKRNAVQIDDLAVNNQLNEGPGKRRLDHNACGPHLEKIRPRTTHQDDGCSLAFDFQQMRPGRFKILPFGERDHVVQIPRDGTVEGARL